MMQEQKLAPRTKYLLETSTQFYQELLGYKPEQTKLQQVPENQWTIFCKSIGQPTDKFGIYSSRNKTAVIQQDNPLSLFHEYFGHGLYCEQSLAGRKLINLERKLFEEEKQEFKEKQFTLKDLEKSRKASLTFRELNNFKEQNLTQYELFAVWTEYLLSKKFNINEMFEKRYDNLSKKDKEQVDSIINFSEQYGNLATFYESGLARKTTPERSRKLLEDIYKDNFQDVKFALLYDSKKEFSDIDVFMVGRGVPNEAHSGWLDVKYKSHKEFKKGTENFDVRTLVPLMNGELIFGDREYFKQIKQKALSQPITKEAIKHNLKWSVRMQRLKDENLENVFLKNKFNGYAKTYFLNGLALKKGLRLFTREKLLNSQSEINIQLKGGTE
ncbi:hypothetical protein KAJ87_04270 [Candidatus Pacearchaeota archaeon]|nr:hypothetical protein [Candidatus Pacearchaeota archaeon]